MSSWDTNHSRELYGVNRWGNDFFDITPEGQLGVKLFDGETEQLVSLHSIAQGLKERGSALPHLLRFRSLLTRRIQDLNECFDSAIESANYQGSYRGVYPIKVNQQQQVIEEITEVGKQYRYGLEAGSKPELIAALAYMHDPHALIICNGYKDSEFIDLALRATQMGLSVVIVIEMPSELALILQRSKALDIAPILGIRFRLSTSSQGHWSHSGGDRSAFGLNSTQLIEAIDFMKENNLLDCLKLFHYHQGSQLPNIQSIREAATEAIQVYTSLVKEGAPMGIFDMGGGLAVDYDGSKTKTNTSCNYSLQEYATDMVEIIKRHCEGSQIEHPDIVTESGRAIVAYYSVLIFNILDVTEFARPERPSPPSPQAHQMLHNLWNILSHISTANLQECFNDALFYRDQVRSLFQLGIISLRERAHGEAIYWHICYRLKQISQDLPHKSDEMERLERNLIDFYYANFSVFQSLPDAWAIDQLFPVMPIHHLDKEPTQKGILADITCDCDGKLDRFLHRDGIKPYLPLHAKEPGEEYLMGAFLVGAYQETLGDLHNLLGDTHVVSVDFHDGELTFTHEVQGDSVADVLSYVEYDPKNLESRFRSFAERAVQKGLISASQRKEIMHTYQQGLRGYTYYENDDSTPLR